MRRSGSVLLAAVAALALVASCSSASSTGSGDTGDRHVYDAGLWAQRPVVSLAVDVADDLRTVTGHESVTFTPDLPTCDMVFRAWPNSPTSSRAGASLTVTRATLDGNPTTPSVQAAGAPAGAPGTLVDLTLPRCLAPGQSVRADLDFTLTLAPSPDERTAVDTATHTAWSGTGFPLLAWVRGQGWARDPAVDAYGESAVSEDFAVSALDVTAPSDQQVIGTGEARGTSPGGRPGTTTHHYAATALRDLSYSVGNWDVRDQDVQGVHVHLATPRTGSRTSPDQWLSEAARAMAALSPGRGPFPYPDLWLTITTAKGADGTELPDALQLTNAKPDDVPSLITHEMGHQWFYSLVGNNQARDPWLDESLATFGEQVTGVSDYSSSLDSDLGNTGRPLAWFVDHGGEKAYNKAVYNQGAATLAKARDQVGAAAFDADLRSYVRTNAHRVATPDDFRRAFADQPAVIGLLARTGAVSGGP